ncbi:MAG: hypothetical protein HC831_02140 [Chloroflexia bacterium]|nr:hypothetical protein [Chloroflexia bacterium]
MAEPIKIQNDARAKAFKYKGRAPYYDQIRSINDRFKHLGYNYRGQLYRKTTSPELWGNPLQLPFIGRLEGMMTMILESVKYIKKTFSIAHEKETLNLK